MLNHHQIRNTLKLLEGKNLMIYNKNLTPKIFRMSLVIFKRSFSMLQQWPWMYKFTPLASEERKLLKVLHKFTNDVILKRKAQLEKNMQFKDTKKKMNFLDMLLLSTVDDKPLSNSDIREEVDTIMFEAHDTVASVISFTLYSLSRNQNIQNKVFNEIRQVFGDDLRSPLTFRQLRELKYVEMVIKESMRVYTPAPIIGRKLTEDTILSGVTVPKGTNIMIPIWSVHHDPMIYPDPESFDPERFTTQAIMDRNPYSYIPFSAGVRNCVGQKFGILEVKAMIVKMIRNFELIECDFKDDLKLQSDIILKSANGVHLKLKTRNYKNK